MNLAPAASLPEAALKAVHVLVVNEAEGAWLAKDLGCEASALGLRAQLDGVTVLLTRGAEGVDVAGDDGAWHEPAIPVEAIDTTAAGDCFVGVLANRLDRQETLRDAIHRAILAAALCCTRSGSQGSIPTGAETDAFRPANRPAC